MNRVLTLIGATASGALTPDLLDDLRCALDLAGAAPAAPLWLHPTDACDIPVGATPPGLLPRLREVVGRRPVDVALVDIERRKKRLLIADMDSTLIEEECIDELADAIGIGDRVAAITERAMRGELAFEPALRERVALLEGVPTGLVDQVLETRIHARPGGLVLARTMRRHGGRTVVVSGGFTAFAEPVRRRIDFDLAFANVLLAAEGRFLGEVAEPILGREAKRTTLLALLARFGLHPSEAMAVGDGANDLDMLGAAGLAVGMRPKPIVRERVETVIDHGDLSALLYLQGYHRDEWASDDEDA